MTAAADDTEFWRLAAQLLARPGVSRSTMMGFPCLRLHGDFFACCDRRTGDLVVKLTEERVERLVVARRAEHFAPGGRPFREWATVPRRLRRSWPRYLDEALECAMQRTAGGR